MKRVEKESLLKSFILFFVSQSFLVGALFLLNYQKELQTLDEKIFTQMRICSFSLHCKAYRIDFAPKRGHELYRLYKEDNALSSYFPIPNSQKNYLKIYLSKESYYAKIKALEKTLFIEFLSVLLIVFLLSIVFAFYTLSPLRNALHLTEEFIKDILHDFNTPLATLRLNLSLLKRECKESKKIVRIENSVQNILNLQSNLRAYLHSHTAQKSSFSLYELLCERVELLKPLYKDIAFNIEKFDVVVETNRDALVRIIDNLLSNAAKYNKRDGRVEIFYKDGRLSIKDTGKGIQNPSRVFERFYKEQERGIGIGLHIVKKLCDELDITITLESEVAKGTTFILTLQHLTKR